MKHGEKLEYFLYNIGAKAFHSLKEEKRFLKLVNDLHTTIDEIVNCVFSSENLDEEEIFNNKIKLLDTLKKSFEGNLIPSASKSFKDPNIANLEHLEESKKKSTTDDEFLERIATLTRQFIQFPKDDTSVTIHLKKKDGLMQVSATSDKISPFGLRPVFAVDPHAPKKVKGKFEDVLSQINNLVQP